MVRHRDDRLLNEDRVRNYLAQVAPLPFHPDFFFGEQVNSFLESHGVHPGAIQIEIVGRGHVYRPHGNFVSLGKSGESHFKALTTLCTPGHNGTATAITWILHHDYLGALPSHSLVDGWRLRCGDIQVGDNTLLQTLFGQVPNFL
jgi:molecular chaperone HtpG